MIRNSHAARHWACAVLSVLVVSGEYVVIELDALSACILADMYLDIDRHRDSRMYIGRLCRLD
jgi:hypothetical protein